ncbi:hypothetical protein [Providencia sp. PROV117]|uniref:hypothetical protein n=1 Tax=Providencia sp. PROV117 TaxID=2949828 RepID=UPI00234B6A47|nr:hypothetical protein [Providencia sp. PROV117]
MKSNKIVTIEHLSDMKPFPIHGLNKKNNDNFCVYGKSGEGKKVDIMKLKETFDKQESDNH